MRVPFLRVPPIAASAALTAVLLAATPPAARAEDEVLFDQWFVQFHGESKTGWAHERRVHATEGGVPVWVTENEMRLDRGPGGAALAKPMHSTSRFVEDEAGKVISYATSFDMGMPGDPQRREGKVADGVIAAVEDGKARKVPYPEGALGPAAIDRAIAAKLAADATGSVVRFRAIDATGGPLAWKVPAKTELTDVLGRHHWLWRVETTDDTGIPDVVLPDGRGGSWGGATNLGMVRWLRAEEAVAKADADPAALLTSSIVALDRDLDAPRGTAKVVLRLRRKDGSLKDLADGPGQKVVAREKDGAVVVELTLAEPPAGTAILPRPYAGAADMKACLAATPLVETGNERVRTYADAAVSQLVNSLRAARMIELFVHENVQPAPAGLAFGTAAETISTGTGDWSESAVLAVALARASGVPARLVAGFVHWPKDAWPEGRFPHGAFAPHCWAEVLVGDGVWFPIDPLRMDGTYPKKNVDELAGHGGFDATHVALVRSDLATERPVTDVLLPVLRAMDGLAVEVVEPKADAAAPGGK